MIITSKTLIVTTLVALLVFGGAVAVADTSVNATVSYPPNSQHIDVTGNVHGAQTLIPVYQDADNAVVTSSPQPQGNLAGVIQPTINPQH